MTPTTLLWLLALATLTLVATGIAAGLWWRSRRSARPKPLPTEWALTPRPVFNTEERRLYRQLREALPHHIVLAKLPLVRFCQPADPQDVRYWYELLGSTHVTFAICSANGRVLAAIDFDHERSGSRRTLQIKQSVLGACRIRYLRCPLDHLPTVHELQLLVPQAGAPARSPQVSAAAATVHAAPPIPEAARDALNAGPGAGGRRRRRATLWQDSGFFHDSFFGLETRNDTSFPSEFSPYSPPPPAVRRTNGADEDRPRAPLDATWPAPWPERRRDEAGDADDEPPQLGASGGR